MTTVTHRSAEQIGRTAAGPRGLPPLGRAGLTERDALKRIAASLAAPIPSIRCADGSCSPSATPAPPSSSWPRTGASPR